MREKKQSEIEAFLKLLESGLFTKEQLNTASTWFVEYWLDKKAYVSPYKAGDIVGMHGRYIRQLCRDGAINCTRMITGGWWLIPAETLIELRKRVLERQNERRPGGGC